MDSPKAGVSPYGWLAIGVSTLAFAGFYGTEVSFGVVLKPMLEELGWTRAMASGAMSTFEGTLGVVSIVMGRLADKYGARTLVAIGALLGGAGYVLTSYTNSLWQLYLYFGVIVGICTAGCFAPIIATLSRWFVEKRILALGITTSGTTIGQIFLPPLMAYLTLAHGWRFTYIVLAIFVWVAAIPAVMLLGKHPRQATEAEYFDKVKVNSSDDKVREAIRTREWVVREAARTVPFWMLIITGFVAASGFYFLVVHIVAYATDMGIAATSAALILVVISGANTLGKLLVWHIASRIGSRFTLLLFLAIQALVLFLFMRATSLWMFLVLGSLFGFGLGGVIPIRMSMIPEFYGTRSVGTIVGLVGTGWSAGGITGPILAGYIFDTSHSYDLAFLLGGLLMIIGMMATYFLRAPLSTEARPVQMLRSVQKH